MLIKTEGIVIKSIDYGEGNKIITLYTRTHGKVAIMAKGARKPKSRFHAITQIFTYGEYIFYMGKDMGNLNSGELQFRFADIYQDIEKTAFAAYLVELLDKLTEQSNTNPFLFQQLLSSLEQINAGKDLDIIARIFELQLFYISGYRPNLHSCTICGDKENLIGFSIYHGGLICNKHENENIVYLQDGAIKFLKMFEHLDISRIGNIKVKESTKSQLNFVLRAFYDEYIGIPLKSRGFIDQIEKLK